MMTQTSPTLRHSSSSANARPKGILKNSNSYQGEAKTSPEAVLDPVTSADGERPGLTRELSEKEVVMQNTLHNAGHRRSSSNPRGPPSRRQSGTSLSIHPDETSPRLKWDEANLYLTEQERDSTMKITEPKTPYAKHYDPAEDEEEMSALNAQDLMVDELDQKTSPKNRAAKTDEIPGLDLGEPEEPLTETHSESERRVLVGDHAPDDDGRHGEEDVDMTAEEREKHKKFEEARKKHYEMKNIKDLLGHPEEADEDMDEDRPVPPMPSVNGR